MQHLSIFRKNRYSVGIYTPKGVGEGEKPGLTVGTAGGIGHGCGCREIFTLTSIRTALWVKYDEYGCKTIILRVYLSLVGVNPSISFIFPSKIGYVFEIFLLISTRNDLDSSMCLLDLLWKLSILFEFHALLMISILILSKLTKYILMCWNDGYLWWIDGNYYRWGIFQ